MSEIELHEQRLIAAFAEVLKAEDALASMKTRQQEAEVQFRLAHAGAERELADAWVKIETLMAETGEVEVVLPGEVTDFKIARGPSREVVKAEDPDAVPDEFCRTERKPRLKEIGEHLRALRTAGAAMPNWARLERGESKLGWKAVKKSTTKL